MKVQTAVNRIVLALAGLVLLGGGLLVLAGAADIYRRWQLGPPDGWPLATPNAVLNTSGDRTLWGSSHPWWWWTAATVALTLLALVFLWWLITQLRRRRPGRMTVVGGEYPEEGVELRARALSDAITAEASRLPGVEKAHVRFAGRGGKQARVTLDLKPHAAPGTVLQDFCRGPLEHARLSTEWEKLPAEARLHTVRHGPRRAE